MRSNNHSVCVVIPARGGSQGIPRKNLQDVGGVPLVVRAVVAALGAACTDRVVVSTDDAEIAEASRHAGAQIVHRPSNLAGDQSSSESAVLHALDEIGGAEADAPVTMLMQCTSPFTWSSDLDQVHQHLLSSDADSAFSVTASHAFLWRTGPRGALPVNHGINSRLMRQDRELEFRETGALYAVRTPGFRSHQHRFFGNISMHQMPAERSVEIDDWSDLALARALASRIDAQTKKANLPARIGLLALDFDGVLTDNRVLTLEDGTEAVMASRSDGLGLELLGEAGIPALVLSKERNAVVEARCRKLNLEIHQGVDDKASMLDELLTERAISPSEVVYAGNDVNDLDCFDMVACSVAVADAHNSVRQAADIVLSRCGGEGAVRELCDLILQRDQAPKT